MECQHQQHAQNFLVIFLVLPFSCHDIFSTCMEVKYKLKLAYSFWLCFTLCLPPPPLLLAVLGLETMVVDWTVVFLTILQNKQNLLKIIYHAFRFGQNQRNIYFTS